MRRVLFPGLVAMMAAAPAMAVAVERTAPDPEYRAYRDDGHKFRRGKGKQAKPRKRPNRLTISKRVRRKRRRSA